MRKLALCINFFLIFLSVGLDGHTAPGTNFPPSGLSEAEMESLIANMPQDQASKLLEKLKQRQKPVSLRALDRKKTERETRDGTKTGRDGTNNNESKEITDEKEKKEVTDKDIPKPDKKEKRPGREMLQPGEDDTRLGQGDMELGQTDQESEKRPLLSSFPKNLSVFGQKLVTPPDDTPKEEDLLSVPNDTIVGPGDSFILYLSGKQTRALSLEVDREGMVFLPEIGLVQVSGLRLDEFKETIKTKAVERMIGVEKPYITIERLHKIQILMLGDVRHPGLHKVSSLITMSQAILSVGGIQAIGSLRNIQLRRKGQMIQTLDLYSFLLKGNNQEDLRLMDGDVLFVPPIGNTIAITGKVTRPAIYELKNEKTIAEVIQIAGGLLPDADETTIQIERIHQGRERVLIDLDLSHAGKDGANIHAGDIIRVQSVLESKQMVVRLSGFTDKAGVFQWRSGMRVTDLVPDGAKLRPQTDLSYAIITRVDRSSRRMETIPVRLDRILGNPGSSDNLVLHPEDEIILFREGEDHGNTLKSVVEKLQHQGKHDRIEPIVTISGHVRYPGTYPLSEKMGITKLLSAAGDILTNADMDYCLVVRTNEEGRLEPFSIRLGDLKNKEQGRHDVMLNPLDRVIVFKKDAYPAKEPTQKKNFSTTKKFMAAEDFDGFDTPSPNIESDYGKELESTKDMAGVKVERPDTPPRVELLQPILNELREQSSSVTPEKTVELLGAIKFPGRYPLERGMRVSDLVLRAGGGLGEPAYTQEAELTRFALVDGKYRSVEHRPLEINKIIQGDPSADYELNSHDVINIKKVPMWEKNARVYLEGQIQFPGVYIVKPGETLADVLGRAGGLTPYAFPQGAVFLRKELKEREEDSKKQLVKRLEMESFKALSTNKEQAGERSQFFSDLLTKINTSESVGRLAINLPKVLENSGDEDSKIYLLDNDKLFVPKAVRDVTVLGEVYYPTSHQFNTGNKLEDYINLSGGYTREADEGRVYIIKANGMVIPRHQLGSTMISSWFFMESKAEVTPGDAIVVPIDLKPVVPGTLFKDVTQILYNLAVTTATLKTIGQF